jgi:shikimate dehydrogenase
MSERYALFGNPVRQSKSPALHAMFARATGQDMSYEAIEAPPGGFAAALAAFRAAGGRGGNVTAPFKLDAFAAADWLSPRAQSAGAVNTLKFEDGRILADNVDGLGLRRDVEVNLARPLAGRRVLMLGAGGAARGALQPFLEAGPAELVLLNRTVAKAEALVERFRPLGPIVLADRARLGERAFDIVVNATSASLFGERPEVADGVFGPGTLAYELAYGKGLTPFLAQARAAGAAQLADGVGMLVEQGAEGFSWWRGVRPQTAEALAALRVPLA